MRQLWNALGSGYQTVKPRGVCVCVPLSSLPGCVFAVYKICMPPVHSNLLKLFFVYLPEFLKHRVCHPSQGQMVHTPPSPQPVVFFTSSCIDVWICILHSAFNSCFCSFLVFVSILIVFIEKWCLSFHFTSTKRIRLLALSVALHNTPPVLCTTPPSASSPYALCICVFSICILHCACLAIIVKEAPSVTPSSLKTSRANVVACEEIPRGSHGLELEWVPRRIPEEHRPLLPRRALDVVAQAQKASFKVESTVILFTIKSLKLGAFEIGSSLHRPSSNLTCGSITNGIPAA